MVFSSIIFIFAFLPITLVLYYISPRKFKNVLLLIASLFFYAWGEPVYIYLMIFTTIFDYILAALINKNKADKAKARNLFMITLMVNILILAFFKYYDFLIENINAMIHLNIGYKKLPLPVGISFYTFQTLSYVIDVYLGKVKVQKNLISFALYVTMFPQLVAGPIVRYSDINKQLAYRKVTIDKFGEGIERFIMGLGKKVLLANNIGSLWTAIQSTDVANISVLTAWIGIIAYTFQIYFDFSGYSDMAIGLGKMFGFDFIENFNYPYISTSITEFWTRWHISLGSWFREYIYIPLGGNRNGMAKQCRNLFVVWILTGLWHGASWNFVMWGLYYGTIVFLEKLFLKKFIDSLPKFIAHIYSMIIVMVGWVLFGIDNIWRGIAYIKVMFGLGGNQLIDGSFIYYLYTNIILIIILAIVSTPLASKIFLFIRQRLNTKGVIIATACQMTILALSTAYLVNETYNPFLYFRF